MFLDTLEEFRDLSLHEWNFKAIVQDNLANLLEQQRGQIKWAKLGDENTKFFHATSTIRHNKNSVRSLLDEEGVTRMKHEDKALILWESFKERLGTSEFQQIYFDLPHLMEPINSLETLESPFLTEEIDKIISELPNEKSPGPDGFNSDFMKACWNVINTDFYELCMAFYDHQLNLQSINGPYIVLVPKNNNPIRVNDYRPISLLNSSIKLITKLLANRL
jgi:hypothetical protein